MWPYDAYTRCLADCFPAGSTDPSARAALRQNLADLNSRDPADMSPLVFQTGGVSSTPGAQTRTGGYAKNTTILEQPLDFTTLADKYNTFVLDFIDASDKYFGGNGREQKYCTTHGNNERDDN